MATLSLATPARARPPIAYSSMWIPISPPKICSTTAWPTSPFRAANGMHRFLPTTGVQLANALGRDVSHKSAYAPEQTIAPTMGKSVDLPQKRELDIGMGLGLGM